MHPESPTYRIAFSLFLAIVLAALFVVYSLLSKHIAAISGTILSASCIVLFYHHSDHYLKRPTLLLLTTPVFYDVWQVFVGNYPHHPSYIRAALLVFSFPVIFVSHDGYRFIGVLCCIALRVALVALYLYTIDVLCLAMSVCAAAILVYSAWRRWRQRRRQETEAFQRLLL